MAAKHTRRPGSVPILPFRAEAIQEKFRTDRTSASLKKGQAWKNLLAEAGRASDDMEQSLTTGWKAYRATLFAGDTPTKLSGTLAATKGNTEALEAYRLTYDAFTRLFLLAPTDPSVIERAKGLAAELKLMAGRFDFKVKPEVKLFLAAVQAGGAPLSLLTAEVFEWLESTGGMDSYRVHAAETL